MEEDRPNLPDLYIPGPVRVSDETFTAFSSPLMPHRSADFRRLYARDQEALRTIAGTSRPFYLFTSPASAVMEAAARNLSSGKILCCCNGAFSERWFDIAVSTGKTAEKWDRGWGAVITPEALEEKLKRDHYDLVTLVHCETSTGVMNPLRELAGVVSRFPDTLLAVDMVSSFSAVPLEMDAWGLDFIFAGVQKALALPPGMTVACLSSKGLERAAGVEGKGYFFDFTEWEKNASHNMTVATPSISHIHALAFQTEMILEEGLSHHFARYEALGRLARDWAAARGVRLMAPLPYCSPTLTCFENTHQWDLPEIIKRLSREHGILIDGGYGQWKGKTFRISHMGIETRESMEHVFTSLDKVAFC